MEIKNSILLTAANEQKSEFIMNYSQNCYNNFEYSHEIYYTETEIQAWGPTAEEWEAQKVAQQKAQQRQSILSQLDKLDLKSIRAIRATDTEYIAQYEAQAAELRRQLQELDDESSSN